MLTEEEAVERASLFFTMNGGSFITGEVEPGAEYPAGVYRRLPRGHYENGVFWVFFNMLPPDSERWEPNFAVVEVDAVTGDCSYGVVM